MTFCSLGCAREPSQSTKELFRYDVKRGTPSRSRWMPPTACSTTPQPLVAKGTILCSTCRPGDSAIPEFVRASSSRGRKLTTVSIGLNTVETPSARWSGIHAHVDSSSELTVPYSPDLHNNLNSSRRGVRQKSRDRVGSVCAALQTMEE